MLDGFLDFITMIKDFLLSIINGLRVFVESLLFVVNLNATSLSWLPTAVVSVMAVSLVLIVVLRVVGR